MSLKKDEPTRPINHSVRLSIADTKRIEIIATGHDWSVAKTISKLVVAALDAKLVK